MDFAGQTSGSLFDFKGISCINASRRIMPFSMVAPDQKPVEQVFVLQSPPKVKNACVFSIAQLHKARFEFCGSIVHDISTQFVQGNPSGQFIDFLVANCSNENVDISDVTLYLS